MKPTREQIEHRAIEILLNEVEDMCEFCEYRGVHECTGNCARNIVNFILKKAEEELSKPQLTEDEKAILRRQPNEQSI